MYTYCSARDFRHMPKWKRKGSQPSESLRLKVASELRGKSKGESQIMMAITKSRKPPIIYVFGCGVAATQESQ